jgi:hypothetical protein
VVALILPVVDTVLHGGVMKRRHHDPVDPYFIRLHFATNPFCRHQISKTTLVADVSKQLLLRVNAFKWFSRVPQ